MSDMLINAHDARLSILGYQPEVKRIYWSALPNKLPTYGQTLDLSGCEIKAIYADGSEAVVTDFCTFSPDTGYPVPDENTLTVTATYTARSGKVCEADEVLPICDLDHIKIIVPHSVPENIRERQIAWEGEAPTMSKIAQAFGFGDVYVAAYWSQGGEIVGVTKLDTDSVLNSDRPNSQADFGYYPAYRIWDGQEYSPYLMGDTLVACVRENHQSRTFDRYYDPINHESVTYPHAYRLQASYELYGRTFTDTAYLSADVLLGFESSALPDSYSGTETFTISSRDPNIWQLVFSESGLLPLSSYYAYLDSDYLRRGPYGFTPSPYTYIQSVPYPTFGTGWGYEMELTLTDGASGWVSIEPYNEQEAPQEAPLIMPAVKYSYSCDGGQITWTFTHP